jgi:hypothetical protein
MDDLLPLAVLTLAAQRHAHVSRQTGLALVGVVRDRRQHRAQLVLAGVEAELICRFVFEVVRFVDDQPVVRGQHPAAVGDVREHERVVDDHQVRALGPLARPQELAGAIADVIRAYSEAIGIRRREPVPERLLFRAQAQLGPITRVRGSQPEQQLYRKARLVQGESLLAAEGRKLLQAEVVRTPFERYRAQIVHAFANILGSAPLQHAPHGRHVLGQHLLLQADRVGGDDDTLVVAQRVTGRGQEVSERFAGAGSSFDKQRGWRLERERHRLRHLELLGTLLETLERGRIGGDALEDLADLLGRHAVPDGVSHERAASRRCRRHNVQNRRQRFRRRRYRQIRGDLTKEEAQRPGHARSEADDLVQNRPLDVTRALAQPQEDLHRRPCIRKRAMLQRELDAELPGQRGQAVLRQAGHEQFRDLGRVENWSGGLQPFACQVEQVEANALTDDWARAQELAQRPGHHLERWRRL